jgi:hypothetical protein
VSPAAILALVADHGSVVSLTPTGNLRVRSRGPLPANVAALLTNHKDALVAHLTCPTPESWDLSAALDLMYGADDAVAESGVSGTHPEVQVIVNEVCAAYGRKDLAGVRVACARLQATVARLAQR